MTARDLGEDDALRATVRERGTARVWIFVVGLSVWAALTLAVTLWADVPLLSVFPLLVLAATFEAVFALHVAVERVGRYLQVFHADAWEAAAMAFGVPLAGTGTDPLFIVFFALAAVCNLVPVLIAGPVPAEWTALGGVHLVFLTRLAIARRTASRQRAADLARFQRLKQELGSKAP